VRAALAAGLALLLASPAGICADELGRKVFTEIAQPSCSICHTLQAAGASGQVGPSLDELKPDRARVLEAVRKGLGVMPPFGDKLTPEQIEAVADYVARAAR
jgi:mono/diheme cytochrome c family protein